MNKLAASGFFCCWSAMDWIRATGDAAARSPFSAGSCLTPALMQHCHLGNRHFFFSSPPPLSPPSPPLTQLPFRAETGAISQPVAWIRQRWLKAEAPAVRHILSRQPQVSPTTTTTTTTPATTTTIKKSIKKERWEEWSNASGPNGAGNQESRDPTPPEAEPSHWSANEWVSNEVWPLGLTFMQMTPCV